MHRAAHIKFLQRTGARYGRQKSGDRDHRRRAVVADAVQRASVRECRALEKPTHLFWEGKPQQISFRDKINGSWCRFMARVIN